MRTSAKRGYEFIKALAGPRAVAAAVDKVAPRGGELDDSAPGLASTDKWRGLPGPVRTARAVPERV